MRAWPERADNRLDKEDQAFCCLGLGTFGDKRGASVRDVH